MSKEEGDGEGAEGEGGRCEQGGGRGGEGRVRMSGQAVDLREGVTQPLFPRDK